MLYADDTSITLASQQRLAITSILNWIGSICRWFSANKLTLNLTKDRFHAHCFWAKIIKSFRLSSFEAVFAFFYEAVVKQISIYFTKRGYLSSFHCSPSILFWLRSGPLSIVLVKVTYYATSSARFFSKLCSKLCSFLKIMLHFL